MRKIILIGVYFSLMCTKIHAQGLLESNQAPQKKKDNVTLLYKYDGVHLNCNGSGYCWFTKISKEENLPRLTQQRLRSDTAAFSLVLSSFKNLVVSKINSYRTKALADCEILKRQNDTIIRAQSVLYYKNNNLIIVLDSTTNMAEKEKIFDSLAYLSGEMYLLKLHLENTERQIATLYTRINEYNYEKFYSPLEVVISADDSLNTLFEGFEKNYKKLKGEIKDADSLMKIYKDTWNRIAGSILPSNRQSKIKPQNDFSTLPLISSIPGIGYYNANISLFGQTKYEDPNSAFFIQYGGYAGATNTNSIINFNSIFNTETSTYGFFVKNFWGFDPTGDKAKQSQLGINLDIFYLGKKIIVDTVKEKEGFQSSFFHVKAGAEYMIINNLLSVYGNANALSAVTNVKSFEEKLSVSKKINGFIDFGVRMLMNPSKELKLENNFKLYVDINFIIASGDVKTINKSQDIFIPNIRFGVRKSFKN
jgi:hypothetical protein